MLSEAEEVEPHRFGNMHRFEGVADCLGGGAVAAISGARCVAKCVDAEFERFLGFHSHLSFMTEFQTVRTHTIRVLIK